MKSNYYLCALHERYFFLQLLFYSILLVSCSIIENDAMHIFLNIFRKPVYINDCQKSNHSMQPNIFFS